MATVIRRRIGGDVSALNARNHQWHDEGLLITVRMPGGRVAMVNLPIEKVSAILEAAFREAGLPLAPQIGAVPTVGGLFSRVRRAAQGVSSKVVPAKVRRAATKAAKKLDRAALTAANFYARPEVLAALTAASAVPGLGVVTAPLAAGSLGTAAALKTRKAVMAAYRGRPAAALMQAAQVVPGASQYANAYRSFRPYAPAARALAPWARSALSGAPRRRV